MPDLPFGSKILLPKDEKFNNFNDRFERYCNAKRGLVGVGYARDFYNYPNSFDIPFIPEYCFKRIPEDEVIPSLNEEIFDFGIVSLNYLNSIPVKNFCRDFKTYVSRDCKEGLVILEKNRFDYESDFDFINNKV